MKKNARTLKNIFKIPKSHVIDYLDYVDKDVYKVISFLQSNKIKMILASAGERIEIERMLIECHLKKYFDIVLSGEEVANNKPAPDIYLKAVDESGVDKEKCVVIEDSPIGIEAAKKAGLLVWAIKTNIDQTGADKILSNMREIIMNMNLLT
ncbi:MULTISPECIES: HAD family hydrolase [Pediococcus]|uniref:HAD family hydrolase n=1 Tax=Pediococcus TaxID=1253 RepID=UPI00136777AA|nr:MULTISPECIES: HAD family hydrolase [Pediococcus]QHM65145.1 Phosphorylated carbohydrates phosphatase [Pediococcus pentosaceus]QHM66864.1 Phosphorylated carbohydrates phosphatase [Pediococcus pentosaceus]QHM68982.1 Phosphorylated carbohydrates phosphatase [Pediococcus pentosaceus]